MDRSYPEETCHRQGVDTAGTRGLGNAVMGSREADYAKPSPMEAKVPCSGGGKEVR